MTHSHRRLPSSDMHALMQQISLLVLIIQSCELL